MCLSCKCDLKVRNEHALHLNILALVLSFSVAITCGNFLAQTDTTRINWHNIIVIRRLEENVACSYICSLFLYKKTQQTKWSTNCSSFKFLLGSLELVIWKLRMGGSCYWRSLFQSPHLISLLLACQYCCKNCSCLHFP